MSLVFRGPDQVLVSLHVNGRDVQVFVEPRRTLLSVLREELCLTGAKHGCGRGTCGACTAIVDGETVYSCLTLAIDCEGREIRTVEGLACDQRRPTVSGRPDSASTGERLHPVQEAFIEHDGYQCGFCTPGQVMSAVALLEHNPHPTEEEIRYQMAGNVCRCGAYPNIVRAVQSLRSAQDAESEA